MITTLTVNPSIDLTLEVDGLLIEDVNRVKRDHEDIGGKGINVSKVLHELGENRIKTLAVLGGKRSERFLKIAKADGLKIQPISISGETRINITLYDEQSRKTTKLNPAGPLIKKNEEKKIERVCAESVRKSSVLVLAGSLPPGLHSGWYAGLLKNVRRNNLITVVDADGDVLKRALAAAPYLIKPNRFEAERALGRRLQDNRSILLAARRLRSLGAKNVIISLGREGALFSGPQGEWWGYSVPVKTRSTIGAGDAFLAGFLYQSMKGKSVPESLKFGMACGTHTAMLGSTELCHKSEVLKLVSKMKIKKVNGD